MAARPGRRSTTFDRERPHGEQPGVERGTKSKSRKLTGLFGVGGGEDGRISQPYSDKTRSSSNNSLRARTNSVHARDDGRPVSPTSSRPRTPLPSSEVTPWVFQDFQVSTIRLCSKISCSFPMRQEKLFRHLIVQHLFFSELVW